MVDYMVETTILSVDDKSCRYLCWKIGRLNRYESRLIVHFENQTREVKVCFEVAYELFEGHTNFQVETVGRLKINELNTGLATLLSEAVERIAIWKPDYTCIYN